MNQNFRFVNVVSTDTVATGRNMRRLCKEHGVKVSWLAEQFGVSEQAVYSWFRGEKMPQIEFARAMARMFQIHLEDLYIECGYDREEVNEASSFHLPFSMESLCA